MSTTFCWTAIALASLVTAAAADDKVDAAKTEVCEKSKKFLADQEAKGKCRAEAAEAKGLTCSPATFKQVTDLQTRCITAKPVAKPAK